MSISSEPPRPIWVNPREACRISSLGLTLLYEYLNDGTIESRRIGNRRLVSVASLERLGEGNGAEGFSPPSLTGRRRSDRSPAENLKPVAAPSQRARRGRSTVAR
jgi:hypothetical protein